ncbi:hypothetical protein QYF61_020245 [Mycteria americana]|uniref:Uncharacterized protein n=1 Tax=Mycteria americana TaxID=33587 RepID=A0AAN7RRU5_MYCAM|nr:hypothetical protein QYF61_020245 [Mycteria americana]
MHKPMEKSQNFRIEALLAEEPARSASPPGLSPGSPAASPGPAGRSDTPSPRAPPAAAPLAPAGFVPKPGLLHLPGPGLGALPALYPPAVYPLPALGGQHPAFAYTGIPHLPPPGAEHLKAAVAGSFPLEHWIRAGMLVPRLSDFHDALPSQGRSGGPIGGRGKTRAPETSEGCGAPEPDPKGKVSSYAGPVLRDGPEGHCPPQCRRSRAAPGPGRPQLPAPHGRRGLVGLRRGGKETKIKKRRREPAPGNECMPPGAVGNEPAWVPAAGPPAGAGARRDAGPGKGRGSGSLPAAALGSWGARSRLRGAGEPGAGGSCGNRAAGQRARLQPSPGPSRHARKLPAPCTAPCTVRTARAAGRHRIRHCNVGPRSETADPLPPYYRHTKETQPFREADPSGLRPEMLVVQVHAELLL